MSLGNSSHPKPKNQGSAGPTYTQQPRTSGQPARETAFPASGSCNECISITKPGTGSSGSGSKNRPSLGGSKEGH